MHEHDGFYLRLGLGVTNLMFDWKQQGQPTNIAGTARGGGASIEIGMGGTVAPGLVLGGVLFADTAGTPTTATGTGPTGRAIELDAVSVSGLGLLADWYVNPRDGWHVQAALSLSTFHAEDSRSTTLDASGQLVPDMRHHDASGGAFSFGGGYEFWIAEQWSLGPLVRFTYSSTKSSDDQWTHRSWSLPTIMVAGTYQ